jgi:transcriptional regulator with XRE-family HTH domain
MTRITKPMMDRGGAEDQGGSDLAYQYRRIIGNRVRDLRLNGDLTQRQLADLLSTGETSVSALELGRSSVSPERYLQLADIFSLDKPTWGKWLLRYTDPYLYALLFGFDDPTLKPDLEKLNVSSRVNRTRGPRH